MAQRKSPQTTRRTTSTRNTSSGRSARGSSASSRGKKSVQPAPVEEDTPSIFSRLWESHWGKLLYGIIVLLLIIGLDLLISWNKYDLFYTILGIEIVVAMLVGWVVYLILERRKQHLSEDTSSDEDS